MGVIVQFDFPFPGPFGPEMEQGLKDLAVSITEEPGFVWKIWTENAREREAGGIYLFRDRPSAEAYVAKHTARLAGFGVQNARAKIFEINGGLTQITHGPAA
jgi:hypothetical protein